MANRFWVGGAGTWDGSDTSHWSATTGGAAGASAPTTADTAIFDSNSGSGTVSVAATATAGNVTINQSTITVQLAANATLLSTGLVTLTSGTLDLNGFILAAGYFDTNNTNARTLTSGAGSMALSGNNGVVVGAQNLGNLVVDVAPTFNLNYSGATGTRTYRWGSTSGGVEDKAAHINVTAGTDTFAATAGGVIGNLNFTGFAGSWTNASLFMFGNLTVSTGMTVGAGASVLSLVASTGTKMITSAGKTLDFPLTFGPATFGTPTATWQFADAAIIGSTRTVTLTNGTLDGNGNNISLGLFALGSGTKTLTLGSGTWSVTGAGGSAWNAATNVSGLTVSVSAGTISMDSASAKTFAGGGKLWPTLNQGGAGDLTITGANTFATLSNGTNGTTIVFPAGVTTSVTNFLLTGASGSLTTLQSSSSGSPATISKASGTVTTSYLSIKDSTATGGAVFRAPINMGNVNVSGNSGWIFNAAGSGGGWAGIGMGMGITL